MRKDEELFLWQEWTTVKRKKGMIPSRREKEGKQNWKTGKPRLTDQENMFQAQKQIEEPSLWAGLSSTLQTVYCNWHNSKQLSPWSKIFFVYKQGRLNKRQQKKD